MNVKNKIEIFDVLYNYSINFFEHKLYLVIFQNLLVIVFYVTLMKIFNEFKQWLKTVYAKNFYWTKILVVILLYTTNVINDILKVFRDIKFRFCDNLVYYMFKKNKDWLYVFKALDQKIFRIIYNLSNYEEFYWAYNRLMNFVYVKYLAKRLRIYIEYCSQC